MVQIPVDDCSLYASKHFRNTWMKKWDWDFHDLREAIRDAYHIDKMGVNKFEVYVRKKGNKKLILIFEVRERTVFVITGTEGKA